jgi:hypothetical protein
MESEEPKLPAVRSIAWLGLLAWLIKRDLILNQICYCVLRKADYELAVWEVSLEFARPHIPQRTTEI